MSNLIFPELSYKLSGIFFEVQNKLGTKFQEKHYVKAVASLLKSCNIPFELEVSCALKFHQEVLGSFKVDMTVDDKILIEFKATDRLTLAHKQQMIRYLDCLDMRLGILVNFRVRPLQIMRVTKSKNH
jgi:GxxExxY protein